MSSKHEHHSSKKHGHKHHHHNRPKVDLKERKVYLDSETYEWDDTDWFQGTKWYRFSTHWVIRCDEKVPFVKESEREEWDDDGDSVDWDDVKHRFKNRKLIRILERLVKRAERKKEKRHDRKKREKKRLRRLVLEREGAQLAEPEEGHDNRRHLSASDDGKIKHTKRGVRITSYGGKYYFNVAVFKSTKYPGHASVQLVVAGKWFRYMLDGPNMKALREEVARGGN